MTTPDPASTGPARPATVADVPELVRLRAVMFGALADHAEDDGWQESCAAAMVAGLGEGWMVAFVVDAPGGHGLATSAVGFLDRRLPGPGRSGTGGHVGSVATDPRWRRRGLARAAVTALLDWFDAAGVARVELGASAQGEPLYRSLGFVDFDSPRLVRRRTP